MSGLLCAVLHGFDGADQEAAALGFDRVAIEGTGGGAVQDLAFDGEIGGVAGADEFVFGAIEMVGAAEVCAAWGVGDDFRVGEFHDPGSGLLGNEFPTVFADALEGDFFGDAGFELGEIGGVDEAAGGNGIGRTEEISKGRNAESARDQSTECLRGTDKEIATIW